MIKSKNFEDVLNSAQEKNKKLYEICEMLEADTSEISTEEVRDKVKIILDAMKDAIKKGLKSKEKSMSGMCGDDCAKLLERYKSGHSLFSETYQKVLTYSLATIEQNLRMGKIVACPTAGSCGIVPAVIIAIAESINAGEEEQINALITAGLIGKIVANKLALAGAVAGCQSECGVAAAMAAAGLVEMYNGSNEQILSAAALTLKNIMGLVCDPVAGLVEVPCVKRNAFLAIYAVTGAELAMANIRSVIPIDEVVDAMKQVGEMMSPRLKESSEAGLATTKTGLEITQNLAKKWQEQ
ncbi:MAG: L-serine ammonia-lyase, iron-sulfur-dependent, subunit alpha [Opitutales bacterium]|jgi:L-serine dehydratase, iron-sulfur-dependent, alpha subunit|nr:L-serine ammonia-lyase, iron-sulfur-dependent, subunit alpha [Clostridium sp.]